MTAAQPICPHCKRDTGGAAICPHCGHAIQKPQHPSVMRGLGLALGDLWSVVKTGKTKPPKKHVVRQRVEEEEKDTPQGKVTLRRTVIEEIEIRPDQPPR
jgi:hypothetical protein